MAVASGLNCHQSTKQAAIKQAISQSIGTGQCFNRKMSTESQRCAAGSKYTQLYLLRNQIPALIAPMRDMIFGAKKVADNSEMAEMALREPIMVDDSPRATRYLQQ